MSRSPRASPPQPWPTTSSPPPDEPPASAHDARPILAIHLDMAAPAPRTPPRPPAFELDLGLLSPPPESAPFPVHSSYSLLAPDDDQPLTLSFAPTSPPAHRTQHRAASAPPTVASFFDGPASPAGSPPRARTALARRSTADLLKGTHKPTLSPGGELLPPPPPLFRPTTFWKNTKRSGVTGTSYSPGSHLIRRATFIAAGLALDRPVADLSAFAVESRAVHLVLPPDSALTISASHE